MEEPWLESQNRDSWVTYSIYRFNPVHSLRSLSLKGMLGFWAPLRRIVTTLQAFPRKTYRGTVHWKKEKCSCFQGLFDSDSELTLILRDPNVSLIRQLRIRTPEVRWYNKFWPESVLSGFSGTTGPSYGYFSRSRMYLNTSLLFSH